jgi:DNA-binding ferritin-like protein
MVNRQTRKKYRGGVSSTQKVTVVQAFLDMLNTIKLYHWNTHSYPEHKATDELYGQLNEHIDKFVEVMLGKDGSRVHKIKTIHALDISNTKSLLKKIEEYKQFLIGMTNLLNARTDSDLLNIRDEILGDLNQFTYLLTLH